MDTELKQLPYSYVKQLSHSSINRGLSSVNNALIEFCVSISNARKITRL